MYENIKTCKLKSHYKTLNANKRVEVTWKLIDKII